MAFQGVTGFTIATIKDMLNAQKEPAIKQFFTNDTDGDPTSIYYAQSAASAGDSCLEQVLAYTTVSGIKCVEKIAWRTATWSGASWDIS